MYQRVGKAAYKANLDNTIKLARYLGNPENQFKSIHVAGTNGKGSTSHILASVLQEAGYNVGLYTSPHLKDFRERIKINGTMIPKRSVSSFVTKHKSFFETNQLSFFEMTVGLAFDFFRKEQVDIAIVEVGLGGRLDSTNIISPEVSIITNIGMDHTKFLGNTMDEIASEKAGIIKTNTPIVIGETTKETKRVFKDSANSKGAPIYFAEILDYPDYPSDLKGWYQEANKKTALVVLDLLKGKGFVISKQAIEKGLLRVTKNTGLQGRWQQLKERPKVICDTAHNREGLEMVFKQLQSEKFTQLHIVLGTVDDKNLKTILSLFPIDARYYFCKPNVPRGLDVATLQLIAKDYLLMGSGYSSVKKAYKNALKNASDNDLIYVGGSTFVVAEIL